jgi:hypothetical protein
MVLALNILEVRDNVFGDNTTLTKDKIPHNFTMASQSFKEDETVQQALISALYKSLRDEKMETATVMEKMIIRTNGTYSVHFRIIDNIPYFVEWYKEKEYVIRKMFLINVCGIDAYLLGMEHIRGDVDDTLCVVGTAFEIKVYGHCVIIQHNSVMKVMKKNLLYHGCASCGNPAAKLKCAGCRCRYYCNDICQKKDWKEHKQSHYHIEVSREIDNPEM